MSNLRPDCSHSQISSETSSLTYSVEFPIQNFNLLSLLSHADDKDKSHLHNSEISRTINFRQICLRDFSWRTELPYTNWWVDSRIIGFDYHLKLLHIVITYTVSSEMEVVDVPEDQPVISGIRSHYRLGELIVGNCTSPLSRPAANVTWLMNDKLVNCPRSNSITYTIRPMNSRWWWKSISISLFSSSTFSSIPSSLTLNDANYNTLKKKVFYPTARQYPTVKDEIRNLFSNTAGITFHLAAQHLVHGRLKVITRKSYYKHKFFTHKNRITSLYNVILIQLFAFAIIQRTNKFSLFV